MMMNRDNWCKYYNGLIGKMVCDANVKYDDVTDASKSGLNRFPCFKGYDCNTTCDKQEWHTESEIREHNEKLDKTIKEFSDKLKRGVCPVCEASVEKKEQVGRCVYAQPCGHRMYQGRAI